jgi:hypothetical protein
MRSKLLPVMRTGDGVAIEVVVDLCTALQCLETGHIGRAACEIKHALCALGLWDTVKARTGPLTVLNQKGGYADAETQVSMEWLDVLRKDGWIAHCTPQAAE